MALLTADDILNKKFTATKFREGYDVVEVDDFLDEVLETLRGLQEENEGLKTKLAASEQRVSELSRASASGQAPSAPEATPEPEPAPAAQEAPPEPEPEPDPEPEPAPEAVQEPEPQADPEPVQHTSHAQAPAGANSRANEPESATGMLQLAQKLHDDYVRSGQEEGERLVTEAKDEGTKIVRDAQETSDHTLQQLEKERSLLERKIDELRQFERDYRTRLQSYLEQLLGDLDNRGAALPDRGDDQSRPGI